MMRWKEGLGRWIWGGWLVLGLGSTLACSADYVSLGENVGESGGSGGSNNSMPGNGGSMPGSGGSMSGNGGTMPGSGGPCPLIACFPEFERDIEIDDPWIGDYINIYVKVDHNSRGMGGSTMFERSLIGAGSGYTVELPMGERDGQPLMSFTVWGSETPDKLRLTVSWRFWQQSDGQDGDVFKLSVGNANEASYDDLFSGEWVVNYVEERVAACTLCLRAVPIDEQ
jgi:hypothetical protein